METNKIVEIDREYCDVTDIEIYQMILNYPELLHVSNDMHDRYMGLIQLDTDIVNNTCSN